MRGFLGLSRAVVPGYENLTSTIRVSGDATEARFAEMHAAVMATSPSIHNMAARVKLRPGWWSSKRSQALAPQR